MAQIATTNFGWQNKFSTTLTSGITASDTTIPLNALPTPTEGFLVIEPDSSTNWEVIYYTSKTGSAVVCTSAAAGRGQDDSTAISHSAGATVRMDTTAGMFEILKNASVIDDNSINTVKLQTSSEFIFDHVNSGCVWTADAAGSTRVASMTSGVVYIAGKRLTVVAVTSRTFTASKDVYVDFSDNGDGTAVPNYNDGTTNAASPALSANRIRNAIVVVGATSIATAASINQGQEDRVLPIASSVPYAVTDSLGNLICPRDPARKLLGYRQIVSSGGAGATSDAIITGLSFAAIIPTGRKVKASVVTPEFRNSGANTLCYIGVYEGASLNALTTLLNEASQVVTNAGFGDDMTTERIYTPTSTTLFYSAAYHVNSGTATIIAAATTPTFVKLELE